MNELKMLLLADLHLGNGKPEDLFEELNEVFFKYIESQNHDIDLIVILGDFFHRKLSFNEKAATISNEIVDKLINLSKTYGIATRWLKGTNSHDHNQLNNYKYLNYLTDIDIRIIDHFQEEELIDGYNVLYLPEEQCVNVSDFYKDILSNKSKYQLIFGHGTFEHQSFPEHKLITEKELSNSPVLKLEDWSPLLTATGHVYFGHIHNSIKYKNITYVGAFSRNAHDESPDKGFLHITKSIDIPVKEKFIVNNLAKTYKTFNISEFITESSTVDSIIETIKDLKKLADNVKIKIDIDFDKYKKDINLISNTFSSEKELSLEIKKKVDDKSSEIDDKFKFILDDNLSNLDLLVKYLEVKYGIKPSKDKINELISDN